MPQHVESMVEDGEFFIYCAWCNTWLQADGYQDEPETLIFEHEAELHD